jgi:hypothetical protein
VLKELFKKKKETGFALYHDKAFEKKIQQEKITCERNLIK